MNQQTYFKVFPVILFVFFLSANSFVRAQDESESSKRIAKMMAEKIDANWDQPPEEGMANIRVLMTKDGEPFAGKVSIHTDFTFSAKGKWQHNQGFNPNSKGRWMYDGLEPGIYKLEINGLNKFENFKWTKEGVTVKAGDSPLFEISLD